MIVENNTNFKSVEIFSLIMFIGLIGYFSYLCMDYID